MNQIQIITVDIVKDVVEGLDHLVPIPVIHHRIEEDHLNIRKQSVDIVPIPEAEEEIESAVKRVTKAPGIVIQKAEKGIGIVLNHDH